MAKMTTEEAFVKVLQMHGIEHAFGIIGSAFMPISDLFPKAGITFWDVAHETNGGLIADGYTRATGKMSMVIAQNGPGITGLVTPIKTAYWNHTPLLLVTPQAANKTMGQGGFQEVEQINLFKVMVPAASSGIIVSVILAFSRAIGETMIVAIAAGQQPRLTANPLVPIETITTYIVQVSLGDVPHGTLEYKTIFAAGIALFVFTFILNNISYWIRMKFREQYD